MDRLIPDPAGTGATLADIVIEAISEQPEAKLALYRALEPRMKPDAVLATNTSSLSLETLRAGLARPERLVGIHFFNPVAKMPLVEVVHADGTAADALARASVRRPDRQARPAGQERARLSGQRGTGALHTASHAQRGRGRRAGRDRRGPGGLRHADGTAGAGRHRGSGHRPRRRRGAGRRPGAAALPGGPAVARPAGPQDRPGLLCLARRQARQDKASAAPPASRPA